MEKIRMCDSHTFVLLLKHTSSDVTVSTLLVLCFTKCQPTTSVTHTSIGVLFVFLCSNGIHVVNYNLCFSMPCLVFSQLATSSDYF